MRYAVFFCEDGLRYHDDCLCNRRKSASRSDGVRLHHRETVAMETGYRNLWKYPWIFLYSFTPLLVFQYIRFSGSWALSHFFVFPTQADKTEAITGQVAYHILSVVKQKPSGRTKCKIKMNWNFKWKTIPAKNKPPVSLLFQGSGGSSTKRINRFNRWL